MGLCESCMKDDAEEEHVPLLPQDALTEHTGAMEAVEPVKKEDQKDFFQRLIDEANGRFISSEYRHTQRTSQTPDEIRLLLQGAGVDASLIASPPSGARFEASLQGLSQSPGSGNCNGHGHGQGGAGGSGGDLPAMVLLQASNSAVLSVLSAPVAVSEKADVGADEIAEIVSSHIRGDRQITAGTGVGAGGSVVAHFQPMAIPSSGN